MLRVVEDAEKVLGEISAERARLEAQLAEATTATAEAAAHNARAGDLDELILCERRTQLRLDAAKKAEEEAQQRVDRLHDPKIAKRIVELQDAIAALHGRIEGIADEAEPLLHKLAELAEKRDTEIRTAITALGELARIADRRDDERVGPMQNALYLKVGTLRTLLSQRLPFRTREAIKSLIEANSPGGIPTAH